MHYGTTFRNMTELFAGPSASYGVISIPDTKAIMPMGFEYPFVVHPATLDSALHLLFPSISGEDQFHGYSTAQRTSYNTWKSSITISEDLSEPMIIVEGISLASVGDGGSTQQPGQDARASCFTKTWHEDVDLLEPLQIKDLVYKRTLKSQDDESVLDYLEFVCLVYVYRCLAWFESEEGKAHVPQDGFWKLYVEWMRNTVKEFPPLPTTESQVTSEMESSRASIVLSKSGDVTVQMVDRIGDNLSRIFTREVEPLQVMTEGDLLYDFYRGAFGTSFNTHVAEYVGLVADKSPGVKILEISAGTGSVSSQKLAQSIQKQFESSGHDVSITQWDDVFKSRVTGKYCLCLAEWEDAVLATLTDENWGRLRQIIRSSYGTLWITGGAAMDCPDPMKSLMVGPSRAIRNEDVGVRLATLDFETADRVDFVRAAKIVLKVASIHAFSDESDGEYAARDLTVYVPRVERILDVGNSLRKYERKGQPELVSFRRSGRPLKLTIKAPGLLDTFRWDEDEIYHQPLPEDWVEIEVKSVGLHFKVALVALGNLAEDKLGVDASGVITRVGSAVRDFKPGDHVMTASCATFATFVRFPAKGAIPIPAHMSFEQAASMPLIFLIAYY
ncbi:Putative polyketide synthase 2 [Fusarium odoratissimum]|uniref:Putative polyketide synthase 2 n=1 Tax=Fusarium oxysporum f. sp. cubense (strain race 4) TaxID=2502994 RepID=N1S735_FUSC4|nr:Putative polyketide synthase 2 [Fusarium odoratissimum]